MTSEASQPLVSVMIPCYNSAKTLPMALASVLAQTYSNWECIVVDDGSTDNPYAVVSAIGDARIRFHRFEENRGRAAARQQALDMAHGEYLCMVDADDWIYPWKIERQVEIMEQHPDLGVLSTGMAIVNAEQKILSVRIPGANQDEIRMFEPMRKPRLPPIAHAPSMLRMHLVRRHQYDLSLTIAEDVDYLFRVLQGCRFGVLAAVTYSYAELGSYSLHKMQSSLQSNLRMFSKYRSDYPMTIALEDAKTWVKLLIYQLAHLTNFERLLLDRRSIDPTDRQVSEFYLAKEVVFEICESAFSKLRFSIAFQG